MAGWNQGFYECQVPTKYKGNGKPKFKSSLEQRMMWWLDHNKNIIEWSYEPFWVSYQKPEFDRQFNIIGTSSHRYYLDFWAIVKETDGSLAKYLIEVKCYSETIPPVMPKRKTPKAMKTYMQKCVTFAVNQSKWNAAKLFCNKNGMKFKMMLDTDLSPRG